MSFSLTSFDSIARLISAFNFAKTSGGVLLAEKKPNQVVSSNSGNPCSAIVGTSGSAAERCALVTAKAFNLPALMNGMVGGIEVLEICV